MKICRYQETADGPVKLGVVRDGMVHDVTAVTDELPAVRWPYPAGDQLIANLDRLRPRMERLADQAAPVPVDSVLLKSPVANPGKFVCGAGNHKVVLGAGGHPRRLGFLFKMTSAAAGPSDGVILRWPERVTFHEAEIAIVIGKQGTEIPASEALDYVAGYCIALDMTQQGPEFPSFGKSFDTFGMMGPWLTTRDEIADANALNFHLTRQRRREDPRHHRQSRARHRGTGRARRLGDDAVPGRRDLLGHAAAGPRPGRARRRHACRDGRAWRDDGQGLRRPRPQDPAGRHGARPSRRFARRQILPELCSGRGTMRSMVEGYSRPWWTVERQYLANPPRNGEVPRTGGGVEAVPHSRHPIRRAVDPSVIAARCHLPVPGRMDTGHRPPSSAGLRHGRTQRAVRPAWVPDATGLAAHPMVANGRKAMTRLPSGSALATKRRRCGLAPFSPAAGAYPKSLSRDRKELMVATGAGLPFRKVVDAPDRRKCVFGRAGRGRPCTEPNGNNIFGTSTVRCWF